MIKLYRKSEIWFAVTWIIAYCLLFSIGDRLSELTGVQKSVTAPLGILLSSLLLVFLKKKQSVKRIRTLQVRYCGGKASVLSATCSNSFNKPLVRRNF